MTRSLQWVNSPVLLEALERYEQRRLPRSMQLWVEECWNLKPPLRGHGDPIVENPQSGHGGTVAVVDVHHA